MSTRAIPFVVVCFLMSLAVPVQGRTSLKEGDPFPVISMPDSESGKLASIADFRGQKLMLQIFAGW